MTDAPCNSCDEARRDAVRSTARLMRLRLEAGDPMTIAGLQSRLERLVSFLLHHQQVHAAAS
jgi:hypothetical protein